MPAVKPKPVNKFRAYQALTGISWTALAKKIGITRPNLMRIVDGRAADIKLSTVQKIHDVTNLSPDDYYVRPLPKK